MLMIPASQGKALADSKMRQRVLANIAKSKEARLASNFHKYAAAERNGFKNMARPKAPRKRDTYGPNTVPHNYVVYGGGSQPDTQFNKADPKLKRYIRRKAAKLRMNNEMQPWAKVERIQKVIRQKVKHAGNELDVKKNPNWYTRYNKRVKDKGALANLGTYLKKGKVVCREMAFITQVALEDAGFESRLVRGDIMKNGKKIGGHAWNEIKLGDKWHIVDTTNTQFNKTDPMMARDKGTSNGWKWKRDSRWYRIGPSKNRRSYSSLNRYWNQ